MCSALLNLWQVSLCLIKLNAENCYLIDVCPLSSILAHSLPVCSCAVSTCFLLILHLTIRMMTTTVHTNISSTSVDGITVMIMMMVDIGKPVCPSVDCCCMVELMTH